MRFGRPAWSVLGNRATPVTVKFQRCGEELMKATLASLMLTLIITTGTSAQQHSMPPLVSQMYSGRWPDQATVGQLNKDWFYQSAVVAYLMTFPVLNTIGMRDGSEAIFGKGYNVLPIWKDRMNAKTWVTTPNCDVIYSMSYLDLKNTGPLVVYAPPGVIGMFTDFLQHALPDVGAEA